MFKILSVILIAAFILSAPSFAFELTELRTETAEELLLFFEMEDLIIATRQVPNDYPTNGRAFLIEARYKF